MLTRNEVVTSNYLTQLQIYLDEQYPQKWQQDILSAYMAATYQLLRNEKTADRLIAGYQLNQSTDIPFYSALSNDGQYLYLLAMHFPQKLVGKEKSIPLQIADKLSVETLSTTEAAFNALALAAYVKVVPASAQSHIDAISYDKNNKIISTVLLQGTAATPIPAGQQRIELKAQDTTGFFYQFSQAGFLQQLPSQEIKEGIEISRQYLDADNKAVTTVKVGDEVFVHINLRTLKNEIFSNIAVVDLLPGGFELMPQSFSGEGYHEVHEDRALFFVGLYGDDRLELTYRMRAIVPGKYTVPAITAEAMYNSRVHALASMGQIEIREREK